MEPLLLLLVAALLLAAALLEWVTFEVALLALLAGCVASGSLDVATALSGFAHPGALAVLLLLILAEALRQSGVLPRIGHRIARLGGDSWTGVSAWLYVGGGLLSGLLNNTSLMALMIPLASELAHQHRRSPSELLLSLNYVVVTGGTLTLIGTSSTLIAASLASERGVAPLGFFELAPVGAGLLVVSWLYGLLLQRWYARRAAPAALTATYELSNYLTELRIAPGSRLAGRTVLSEELAARSGLTVLEIVREGRHISYDLRSTPLEIGDLLLVRGSMRDILAFEQREGLELLSAGPVSDRDLASEDTALIEVQVAPISVLEGATLSELDLRRRFGVFVLAIARAGEFIRERLAEIRLKRYDTLLTFGPRRRVEQFIEGSDVLPLRELELPVRLSYRWWVAALGLPSVALGVTLFDLPLVGAALVAVAVVFLSRATSPQRVYRSLDWSIYLLLATSLPLGILFERTGGARWLAEGIFDLSRGSSPWLALALVYLVAVLLSELLSNGATVVLLLPAAIQVAEMAGADPRPFVVATALGACLAFASPIGYQTHAMVYSAGHYRLRDLAAAGIVLDLVLAAAALLLIPIVWPLSPPTG